MTTEHLQERGVAGSCCWKEKRLPCLPSCHPHPALHPQERSRNRLSRHLMDGDLF